MIHIFGSVSLVFTYMCFWVVRFVTGVSVSFWVVRFVTGVSVSFWVVRFVTAMYPSLSGLLGL